MERFNQFQFYEIGQAMAKLAGHDGDVAAFMVMGEIWNAQRLIKSLLDGVPIPIGVSRAKAQELLRALEWINDLHFSQAGPDGNKVFRFPEPADPPIPSWRWSHLKQTLVNFETVFREEMRDTATYFVPRRGIFYTPALVDTADETFPEGPTAFCSPKGT